MSNGTAAFSADAGAANAPRLCHVIKVDDFDGYGFNLHAEKGKPGQYIGKVDEGSPAETAGLKQGDRIIEVNGVNIANENHKQVVQRIKTLSGETKLLVVTPEPGEDVPNLEPAGPKTAVATPVTAPVATEPANENGDAKTNGDEIDAAPPLIEHSLAPVAKLDLSMTAAELRAQLAAKKKVDPKKVPMDLKSKFDIVKKL